VTSGVSSAATDIEKIYSSARLVIQPLVYGPLLVTDRYFYNYTLLSILVVVYC